MGDLLPAVRVPLTDPHPDLHLDLQSAMEQVIEEGDYTADFDCQTDPLGPLLPADVQWLDSLLKANDLR